MNKRWVHCDIPICMQASGQKLQCSSEFSSRFEIREVWLSNSVFFFSDFFTLFDRKLRWIGLSAKMAFFIKAKWFYEAYRIYSNKHRPRISAASGTKKLISAVPPMLSPLIFSPSLSWTLGFFTPCKISRVILDLLSVSYQSIGKLTDRKCTVE